MSGRSLLLILIFLVRLTSFSQLSKTDSLISLLPKVKTDTAKFTLLYKICDMSFKSDANKSKTYFPQLINTAKKLNDNKKLTKAFNISGQLYILLNKLDSADLFLDSALYFANRGNYKLEKANVYDSYGALHEIKGEYDEALRNHLLAIKFHESCGNIEGVSDSYKYIGRILAIQNKLIQGLEYFKRSLQLDRETKNNYAIGQSLNNIAICNSKLKNYDSALYYFNESIRIKTATNNKRGLISSYSYLIEMYLEMGDIKSAIAYSGKLTALAHELNSYLALASAYSQAGEIFYKIKRPQLAKTNYVYSFYYHELAQKKEGLMNISKKLSNVYKQIGNNDSAYYYLELHDVLKDSLFNENNTRSISEMEAKYQNQKKETEISLLQKDKLISETELSKQKAFRNFLLIIAFLILGSGIISYRAYINKRKANDELSVKNQEIEKQNHIIEEKQKDITDSINYALRIQEALLPDKEIKSKLFTDAFILLKQKDIVSGDFYWYSQKGNKKIIAAVDCTGHGVPGAFMSMIGLTFLNEIVNEREITQPAIILDELSKRVITALKQKGTTSDSKDGMDMALLTFDDQFKSVEFAGANNPLWIFRNINGQIEHFEIAPNKRPIGYFRDTDTLFTNHKIELQSGDCLYIFTDGYADQFGGEKGKKFKYKQLKEFLISIHQLPMLKQEDKLVERFEEWKGSLEQLDDVCIIGIRV